MKIDNDSFAVGMGAGFILTVLGMLIGYTFL